MERNRPKSDQQVPTTAGVWPRCPTSLQAPCVFGPAVIPTRTAPVHPRESQVCDRPPTASRLVHAPPIGWEVDDLTPGASTTADHALRRPTSCLCVDMGCLSFRRRCTAILMLVTLAMASTAPIQSARPGSPNQPGASGDPRIEALGLAERTRAVADRSALAPATQSIDDSRVHRQRDASGAPHRPAEADGQRGREAHVYSRSLINAGSRPICGSEALGHELQQHRGSGRGGDHQLGREKNLVSTD